MNPVLSEIIKTIDKEFQHSQRVGDAFLRAGCLLQAHYGQTAGFFTAIHSEFPDLEGQSLTEVEVQEFQRFLCRFIEQRSSSQHLPGAIIVLALARDQRLIDFFSSQLRLHLDWQNSIVVFQLLSALEDCGEKVFYTADGKFIGSRSGDDAEANFSVAKRYLANREKAT
jgi:hypothetical protein